MYSKLLDGHVQRFIVSALQCFSTARWAQTTNWSINPPLNVRLHKITRPRQHQQMIETLFVGVYPPVSFCFTTLWEMKQLPSWASANTLYLHHGISVWRERFIFSKDFTQKSKILNSWWVMRVCVLVGEKIQASFKGSILHPLQVQIFLQVVFFQNPWFQWSQRMSYYA